MRGVDLTWAGGEHRFLLTIEHLRAVQQACDAGPAFVLARLSSQQWLVDDVIAPIRLGLEGGGLSKTEAREIVKKYVENEPLTLSVATAQAIMMAALFGEADDPVGEQTAGAETDPSLSREDAGGSAASTQ